MKKRLLSVFLCLCLVLSLLPETARAADGTTHSHPVCGASCGHGGADAHGSAEWQPLTQDMVNAAGKTFSISDENYYLAENIATDKQLTVSGTSSLCFNGHTLTSTCVTNSSMDSDRTALWVEGGALLNACDCQGAGGLSAAQTNMSLLRGTTGTKIILYGGNWVQGGNYACVSVSRPGTVILDGATLRSTGGGITMNEGRLVVKSGSITSDRTGVFISFQASAEVIGGTITGAKGIELYGTLTLSGSPVIKGDGSSYGDIILFAQTPSGAITVEDGLEGSYTVYRNYPPGLTEAAPQVLTAAADTDQSGHFSLVSSQTGELALRDVEGENGKHTVELYRKHKWARTWEKDETGHWHKCYNDNCTITDNAQEDGYAAHTTQYKYNEYTHWQTCTVCGEFDTDMITEENHVWESDADTTCNTCGYTRTITPPDSGSTQGKVEVVGDAPRTSVDEESLEGLITETPQAGETITVKLTVEKKDEATAPGAADIKGVAAGKTLEFLDLSLVKTVTGGTNPRNEPIDNAANVLEIVMDYDLSGKKDVTAYRYHNGTAEALTKNDTKADGTFQLGTNSITIYTTKFSTYAIGYTPDGGGNQPQPPSGGGNGGGGYVQPTYAVDLPASTPGGKLSASHKSASSGATVTLTLTPEKGYEIGGVTVTDQNGKTVAVTDKGDGKYTFTMSSRKVTVKAEFTKSKGGYANCPRDNSCPIWRFPDADPAAWYHDGVHYCVENGLMSGYGGLFRPDDSLSRAEFVQVLHNLEGTPVVNYLMGFEDIPGGAWYAEAVRWAASRQIAGGYGNGRFGPNHSISREELAVMLWRYAGRPAATGKELNFADAEKASGWATEALCWAVDQGILRGKDGGILDPKGMTTRAEAAAVLQRIFRHGSPAKWR